MGDGDINFDTLTTLVDYAKHFAGVQYASLYGARGDGATDDTAAIQAAINAAYAAGGGIVELPPGVCVIGGAIQTSAPAGSDAATYNAQIRLPYRSPEDPDVSIVVRGATPAGPYLQFTESAAPTSGTILKSTITGTGTKPAIIGGPRNDAVAYPNFSSLTLRIENVTIRAQNNPTLAGLDLEWVGKVELFGVTVDNGVNTYESDQPTTAHAAGIILPNSSNNALVHLRNVYVAGFYCGVRSYEHTFWDNVTVQSCYRGVELGGAFHTNGGPRLMILQCPYGIVAIGGGQNGGRHYLQLGHVDFEIGTNGTNPDIDWMENVATVSDPYNYLAGEATFHAVRAGVGVDYADVNFVGATNLRVRRLDSDELISGPDLIDGFVFDAFNDPTPGQNITAHAPDVGGAWSKDAGAPNGEFGVTAAGRLRVYVLGFDTRATNAAAPPSADYRVSANFVEMAARVGGQYPAVIGRNTAAGTHYRAQFNHDGSNTLYLLKSVGGSITTLGSYAGFTPTIGVPFNVFLRMTGTTIVAGINGVDRVTVTDAGIAAAGTAGLSHYAGSAGDIGDGVGIQFESFLAT